MMRFVLVSCLVFAAGCYGDSIETRPIREWGPYIINGEPADPGEFPSQLSLQYFTNHDCGASIISANWVLTAAHCVQYKSASSIRFLAGTNDLDNPGTYYDAERIIYHKNYNFSDSWVNDIAVVKVATPFNLSNPLTQPIKLPAQGQATADGSSATVIGWGFLSHSGGLSMLLQKVDIAIVNPDECRSAYEPGNTVYPTQICADLPQGNIGSCTGDTGGPLFVNKEVVGLVSWAYGCANQGYPTVYTRVSSYRDWIATNTGV